MEPFKARTRIRRPPTLRLPTDIIQITKYDNNDKRYDFKLVDFPGMEGQMSAIGKLTLEKLVKEGHWRIIQTTGVINFRRKDALR